MIGPRLCAYVDPVFTSQSYDIIKHKCKKNELASFSCAYAYVTLCRPSFHLLYSCACAYAYALEKTRLKRYFNLITNLVRHKTNHKISLEC